MPAHSLLLRSLAALLLTCAALPLRAADEKAPFDPKSAKEGGLGMPTPFDKFLALEQLTSGDEIEWGAIFKKVAVDLDPDNFNEKDAAIPMALGVRIADGVMAIKARDAELLNKCAADIEKLAGKMGIKEDDMGRARAARAAANKGEWLKVFLELGFFQQQIMQTLDSKENTDRGTLLIVAGWMQGARYTTAVVERHYTKEASNILREPLLVRALQEKIDGLPAGVKSNKGVQAFKDALPKALKIVDVPLQGSISKEDVAKLNQLATEAVQAVLASAS